MMTSSVECGSGTELQGTQCVAIPTLICGAGSHDDNGTCVPDPTFQVRAKPTIVADGRSPARVVVVGTPGESVVLSVDRTSAGTLVSPAFVLDDLDGESELVPCNSALASDCLGPATISVALASAPLVPLATVDVELVAPTAIGSAAPCLTGGNVMYFDGGGYGYDTIQKFASQDVDAAHTGIFSLALAISDSATVAMQVVDGPNWQLQFSSRWLGIPLVPSTYPNAVQADTAKPGQPGFYPIGQGDLPSYCLAFFDYQIEAYTPTELTASFTVTCQYQPEKKLSGCVHFSN